MTKQFKILTMWLGVMVMTAAPQATVTCKRQVIPGAEFEVNGLPYGGAVRNAGGKTVISARPF